MGSGYLWINAVGDRAEPSAQGVAIKTLAPVQLDDVLSLPGIRPTAHEDGARGRILIAEDDAACRRMLAIRFALCGFQVTESEDGSGAWERLANIDVTLPAILVTDWRMPNCDGLSLARRVRANPRTADMPIVLFSSDAPALAEQVALNLHFLRKGTRWQDMELLLDEILAPGRTVDHPEGHGAQRKPA